MNRARDMASTASLNGHARVPARSRDGRARGSGRIWPVLVVGLILMNMCVVGVTVYFSAGDPSRAVEPDYYAKALKYDETIRVRERSKALGWSVETMLRPTSDGQSMELAIRVKNPEGAPVDGAAVQAVAFASARAGARQVLTLRESALESGEYLSPVRIDRSGIWRLRIEAQRGVDVFAHETDLIVPE